MKVYGLKNCDTVKKALNWLNEHGIEYEFHDFKKAGVTEEKLKEWSGQLGWEILLNKRGTTWKKLDEGAKAAVTSAETAFKVMQDKTSVIKRPVIETRGNLIIGFDEEALNKYLQNNNR
jgi:arsenate reductase